MDDKNMEELLPELLEAINGGVKDNSQKKSIYKIMQTFKNSGSTNINENWNKC